MIPSTLQEVVDYLKSQIIVLPSGSGDGRTDSTFAETHIVKMLKEANKWNIYSPNKETNNNRAWYDVKIDGLYIDIKVSRCAGNDNTQAKKAIYYLLTGNENVESIPERGDAFFQMMKENENPDEIRDYYYLVINKNDTNDIFAISLKGITDCSIAPNNPPFQVNWNKNRIPTERNWEEAKAYLLGTWAKSLKQLIKLRMGGMPEYYPEFFTSKGFRNPILEVKPDDY